MKKLALMLVGVCVSSAAMAAEGVYVRCTETAHRGDSKGTYDFAETALVSGSSVTLDSSVFTGERYFLSVVDSGMMGEKRLSRCNASAPKCSDQAQQQMEPCKAPLPAKGEAPALPMPADQAQCQEQGQAQCQEQGQAQEQGQCQSQWDFGKCYTAPACGPAVEVVVMKLPIHDHPGVYVETAHHASTVKLYPGQTKTVEVEYRHGLTLRKAEFKCQLEYAAGL
jgi:hypothetical protein